MMILGDRVEVDAVMTLITTPVDELQRIRDRLTSLEYTLDVALPLTMQESKRINEKRFERIERGVRYLDEALNVLNKGKADEVQSLT